MKRKYPEDPKREVYEAAKSGDADLLSEVLQQMNRSERTSALSTRNLENMQMCALGFLYLIVPFWYVSAAYQASLVEPCFVFWRDAVEPKYPW